LLQVQKLPASEQAIQSYTTKISEYEQEKVKIKSEAESFAKEYDDLNVFDRPV
jgi:hypothetical protein